MSGVRVFLNHSLSPPEAFLFLSPNTRTSPAPILCGLIRASLKPFPGQENPHSQWLHLPWTNKVTLCWTLSVWLMNSILEEFRRLNKALSKVQLEEDWVWTAEMKGPHEYCIWKTERIVAGCWNCLGVRRTVALRSLCSLKAVRFRLWFGVNSHRRLFCLLRLSLKNKKNRQIVIYSFKNKLSFWESDKSWVNLTWGQSEPVSSVWQTREDSGRIGSNQEMKMFVQKQFHEG